MMKDKQKCFFCANEIEQTKEVLIKGLWFCKKCGEKLIKNETKKSK